MNSIIDPEGAIFQENRIYNKLCCKCETNYKYQEHFLGDYDLVLCKECYIDILIEQNKKKDELFLNILNNLKSI